MADNRTYHAVAGRGRHGAARRIAGLAAAFAASLAAGGAAAETLADALAKAWMGSPALERGRANLRALDEAEFQERAERLGSVDATGSYTAANVRGGDARGSSRDDVDSATLGLAGSIPIYTGGIIANRTEAAERRVLGGRADLLGVEQTVLLDAVTAFEDVRRDIRLVEVARSNVRVISEQLRAARDRFEVGEVTRTDVSQAEARLAAARSTLVATTGQLARSRQAYLEAIGEAPGELETPPPLPDLPDTEAAAIALAEIQQPDLLQARFDAEVAEANVKVAIGGMLPQVSLEAGADYTDGALVESGPGAEGMDLTLGVRGSVPLWSGGRNPSQVREAQARLAEAQARVHEVARVVRRQVSNAWSGLEVSRASIAAAREQIRAAQLAFDGVREEATLGARTTLDVLDADQELQRARADLIEALRDEYVAGYSLLAAVGNLTAAHLGLAVEPFDADAYRAAVRQEPYDYVRDESTEWSSRLRP